MKILLKLSKEAGCQTWYVGFESISKESLESVNKSNNPNLYPEGIKKLGEIGYQLMGCLCLDSTEINSMFLIKPLNL